MRHGWTQAHVASLLEMHRQQYQAYESGRIEPTIATVVRIADVLDVTIDELAGRETSRGRS